MTRITLTGADIFDGETLHRDSALVIEAGQIVAIAPTPATGAEVHHLGGGTLLPGLIDLQVNGGGGEMVGAATDAAALRRICAAHQSLGTTGLLPTLITETAEVTRRVIEAAITAAGTPGLLGLHLEGPHLDPKRAGAHSPALIHPMTDDDCTLLTAAAARLPCLIVTLAPCAASLAQIRRLSEAGVIVSLGHAEARATEVRAALAAGARMGTHLFNAMSPLGHREPGMVGALLSSDAALGLIADGHHVAPEVMKIALTARPEGVFLVTDAMAVAGTNAREFSLNGRRVLRDDGRLTLEDGTLAGADVTLPEAIRVLIRDVGIAPERAFAMASSIPAKAAGLSAQHGHLAAGRPADIVHLSSDLQLTSVWHQGQKVV